MSEAGDNIIKFRPRWPLTPEEKYLDQLVHALQELSPAARVNVIAASCDSADLQKLAELAAAVSDETDPAA